MDRVSEQISKANASSQGRTDANLANDSNHLGGIAAKDYATKKYVQDYHDGKESDLKGYIDRQDQSVLEEAKEYANSQIRNQDFSGFAKVTDVQALDKKLSGELEEGLTAQKKYTDEKTQAIVDDVNANFEDVNGAISKLNGNMDNLFQSVSNGKAQIAGAITDKGVTTSANDSFSTMATNIRAISSGGGEIDPNFVNTSDGNATENDIRLGKIAYAKGQKIYGSLVPEGIDTDDATATANDIRSGKTAYVKGQKVYGNLIYTKENEYQINPDNPYPQKAEVELIYGEKSGEINISKIQHASYNGVYDISSDNNLMVAYDKESNKLKVLKVAVNLLLENVWAVVSEYTFQDLGITGVEDYELTNIKFSIMNAEQNASGFECRVALLFTKNDEISGAIYKCFIYRISTYDGTIKKENEQVEIGTTGNTYTSIYYNKWEIVSPTVSSSSTSSNLMWSPDSYTLIIGSTYYASRRQSIIRIYEFSDTTIGDEPDYENAVTLKNSFSLASGMATSRYYRRCSLVNNDRIFTMFYQINSSSTLSSSTYILDDNLQSMKAYSSEDFDINPRAFTNDGLYFVNSNGEIYSSTINYSTGEMTTNLIGNIGISPVGKAVFSKDNKFLLLVSDSSVYILSTDFTNNKFTILHIYASTSDLNIIANLKSFEIGDNYQEIIKTVSDEKILVGLKYQGQTFYNNVFNKSRFSAKQEDVRAGKTFIGFDGIPETGTMEV